MNEDEEFIIEEDIDFDEEYSELEIKKINIPSSKSRIYVLPIHYIKDAILETIAKIF